MTETKDSWIDSLKVYKDIRMVRILLLGAISGFPWVLIGSSLSLWLKEEGLSRSTISFNKKTRPQKRVDSFNASCNFT